jgi:hypothetical protein
MTTIKEIVENGTIEKLPQINDRQFGVIRFGDERIVISINNHEWKMNYVKKNDVLIYVM